MLVACKISLQENQTNEGLTLRLKPEHFRTLH